MKKRISINMLSQADKVPGQGVGSAYIEQVNLVKEGSKGKDLFDIYINDNKVRDIQHHHTIDLANFLKMRNNKVINVSYVHFLPHTLNGSIKLPKPIFAIFKKYVIAFYKKADALVVVNPIFIDELAQYGISKEKIYYIPNYVSKETFHPLSEKERKATKEKYHIPLDKKVILSVGQIQHRKGVLDFIEVAKAMPEYLFVWCGGFSFKNITDGYKELQDVVDNPPANVRFLGIIPREDINAIYNIADILFMPSYNELFPMAILEAVNSHVPLVLRDLELYQDILFNKYLAARDNEEFIKDISELLTDKKMEKKYREFSKEISEHYSKEVVYQQWEDFYLEVYEKYKDKAKKPTK